MSDKKPAPPAPVQTIDKEQQKRIVALETELEKVKALATKLVTLLNEGQTELVALRAEVVGLSQDLAEVQVNNETGYVNAGLDAPQTTDYDGEVYAPGTAVKVSGIVGIIISDGITDGDSRSNVGYNVLTVPTVGPLRTVFALRTELVRC